LTTGAEDTSGLGLPRKKKKESNELPQKNGKKTNKTRMEERDDHTVS